MKSSPSWSQLTTIVFLYSAGELPSPNVLAVRMRPRSLGQIRLPFMS